MKIQDPITIELWSDVVCPWCWIGLNRLEKAINDFGTDRQVLVIPRSFRLLPAMPPSPISTVFMKRLNIPLSQVSSMLSNIEATALAEGLTYQLSATKLGDTIDAHRIIKFAQSQGKGHEMLRWFHQAHLSKNLSVFERESLLMLASQCGLERNDVTNMLNRGLFRAEVEADQDRLRKLGGNGVPFFLINGQHPLSGAQPQDVFLQALTQACEDTSSKVNQGEVHTKNTCN
ncbi:DsbA family oxidoreductase [Serratia sp. 22264]|uniref:DsbA family oxidoreductase n=1 Tax=Serratia sp. 22264 TaxID=3453897 RepID=UPI003F862F7F